MEEGSNQSLSNKKKAAIFQVEDLTKTYDMGDVKVHALNKINMEIYPGEFLVLLGPSGSGKSTLLNILGGLDSASSGKVIYDNFDITNATDSGLTKYRRNNVGFVFQFYNLIASLTAQENVETVSNLVKNALPAEEALSLVGLKDRLNHFPSQLSGGEQQRVAIARAITKNPKVLLCDEPTGALDFKTGLVVLNVLKQVNNNLGTATVVITHNEGISKMADRVIKLADGKVHEVIKNEHKVSPQELSW